MTMAMPMMMILPVMSSIGDEPSFQAFVGHCLIVYKYSHNQTPIHSREHDTTHASCSLRIPNTIQMTITPVRFELMSLINMLSHRNAFACTMRYGIIFNNQAFSFGRIRTLDLVYPHVECRFSGMALYANVATHTPYSIVRADQHRRGN